MKKLIVFLLLFGSLNAEELRGYSFGSFDVTFKKPALIQIYECDFNGYDEKLVSGEVYNGGKKTF